MENENENENAIAGSCYFWNQQGQSKLNLTDNDTLNNLHQRLQEMTFEEVKGTFWQRLH